MLKFIEKNQNWLRLKVDFKTSYVEVYRSDSVTNRLKIEISKHLMLKFIMYYRDAINVLVEFQNILCWSLSLDFWSSDNVILAFQNILCWSLSEFLVVFLVCCFVFQNILCWSLSLPRRSDRYYLSFISKHLMLKFIIFC